MHLNSVIKLIIYLLSLLLVIKLTNILLVRDVLGLYLCLSKNWSLGFSIVVNILIIKLLILIISISKFFQKIN